ncbi:MAG: Uncharacterised protein [SAR116 cluster bacterium MED-G04]|nr:MAG: Uncharacterised protein [SAR116 cluster bacterium MED-G04]
MGDHRRAFGLGTGSGGGRDRDQGRKGGGNLRVGLLKFKHPEINVIVGCQADGLATIHGTAAANRDNRIMIIVAEHRPPGTDFIITRVG